MSGIRHRPGWRTRDAHGWYGRRLGPSHTEFREHIAYNRGMFAFVRLGPPQIALFVLLAVALVILASGIWKLRHGKWGGAAFRASSGVAILVIAGGLLWIFTLLQTYLGLTGEIKAGHVTVTPVAGVEHRLNIDMTVYDENGTPRTSDYVVEGDMWVVQADIVELQPWVNSLGFHSGYKLTRVYGQRLDGVATMQNQIFLNNDRDFFQDMTDRKWYTDPFVRSAYGNAVIGRPGSFDIYISRDAIKSRPAE